MERPLILPFLALLLLLAQGCLAQGDKEPLTVVLTFDYEDLSHEEGGRNIDALLQVLEKRNLSVAFFVLGATAEKYPEKVRRIHEKGHILGMHTYYHNLPLFTREDAERVGRVYGVEVEAEWRKSFKTPEAFLRDLMDTRAAIERATGKNGTVAAFRAPSMVVNWVSDEVYYRVLREAGVRVDSSVYQDFENPRAYYVVDGVIEVPLVTFESRLKDPKKALDLAEESSKKGVPFHFVAHPQALSPENLREFEDFLDLLEARYDVTYLRLDEVYGGENKNIY